MDASDWRAEMQPGARKNAVQQIMNAVKLYYHYDDEDGLQELKMFSQNFEQKTFAGATSQLDYVEKITSKEVSIKRKMLQEEVYQKILVLKEMYLPELNEMYQKIANKLQQVDSLPQQAKSDEFMKLKIFKAMLERLTAISESDITPGMSKKLTLYEKQIINFINTNRPKSNLAVQSPIISPSSVASSSS